MKRNISRYLFSICMIFILAVSAVSVIPVQAAATYTLTFRSGNVGSFDTAKVGAAVKNSSLVEVKKEYIKVKAKRGDSVASAVYDAFGRAVQGSGDMNAMFLSFLSENKGYTLLDESTWGPKTSDNVRHNKEYVLDYGTIVNPVSYTVNYVDAESGKRRNEYFLHQKSGSSREILFHYGMERQQNYSVQRYEKLRNAGRCSSLCKGI